ncbi:MAG: hypothetical protein RIQ71_1607 [Verrucomicrobiota bacterium]
MRYGQFPGMQQLARKIGAAPVDPVAGDGMSEVFQMDADLVRATGFRPAFEQTQLAVCGDELPRGFRRARAGPVGHSHSLAVHRMAGNGSGDDTCRGAGFAPDHGEIGFSCSALRELQCQRGMRGVVFRHENATAGVLVQAMHDTGAKRMATRRKFSRVVQQRVNQRPSPVAHGGVDNQPRRFVEADEIVVLVQYFERDVFRLRVRACFNCRRFLRANIVARPQRLRCARRGTVDRNESCGDGALPTGAADIRPDFGKPAIKAGYGLFGGLTADLGGHEVNAEEDRAIAQGLPLPMTPR